MNDVGPAHGHEPQHGAGENGNATHDAALAPRVDDLHGNRVAPLFVQGGDHCAYAAGSVADASAGEDQHVHGLGKAGGSAPGPRWGRKAPDPFFHEGRYGVGGGQDVPGDRLGVQKTFLDQAGNRAYQQHNSCQALLSPAALAWIAQHEFRRYGQKRNGEAAGRKLGNR